jgi:alpha-glucosidase
MLNLYRRLIDLRRSTPTLHAGGISNVSATGNILSYQRSAGTDNLSITLNLGQDAQQIVHPAAEILLSTHLDRPGEQVSGSLHVDGAEGIVARLANR